MKLIQQNNEQTTPQPIVFPPSKFARCLLLAVEISVVDILNRRIFPSRSVFLFVLRILELFRDFVLRENRSF